MNDSIGFTILKNERDLVIYGPASVEVVDKEQDLIRMQAIKEAIPQLMKRGRLTISHSDAIVGEILPEYSVNGKTYMTGVQGDKFFVVGKLWNDTPDSQETRKKVLSGEFNSYSISGTATDFSPKKGYNEINDIALSAVTICAQGMNPYAKFDVIAKQDKSNEVQKMPENTGTPAPEAPAPVRDMNKEFDDYKKSSDDRFLALSKQLEDIAKSLAALQKVEDDKDEDDKKKPGDEEDEKKKAVDVGAIAKEAAEKACKEMRKAFETPKPDAPEDNRPGKAITKRIPGKTLDEQTKYLAHTPINELLREGQ